MQRPSRAAVDRAHLATGWGRINDAVKPLVFEQRLTQGDFVAQSLGMPGVPRIKLPHPVAGTGVANMREVAESIAPAVISALEGTGD